MPGAMTNGKCFIPNTGGYWHCQLFQAVSLNTLQHACIRTLSDLLTIRSVRLLGLSCIICSKRLSRGRATYFEGYIKTTEYLRIIITPNPLTPINILTTFFPISTSHNRSIRSTRCFPSLSILSLPVWYWLRAAWLRQQRRAPSSAYPHGCAWLIGKSW